MNPPGFKEEVEDPSDSGSSELKKDSEVAVKFCLSSYKEERKEILKYLSDTYTRVLSYHNHKELSVWGGVIFFYALIPAVFTALLPKLEQPFALSRSLIATSILIVIYGFTLRYIQTQLELRHYCSVMTLVLSRQLAKTFTLSDKEIENLDFTLKKTKDPALIDSDEFKLLGHRIFGTPSFLIKEYIEVEPTPHEQRDLLEYLPVGMISTGAVLMLIWAWLPLLPKLF